MVLVTMLVKRDQKISFIASGQYFTRTDPDLEDRRSTRDRCRDRHVSHDIVIAAPGQACEKSAGGLNAVLRISGETNYGVIDVFRAQIGPL